MKISWIIMGFSTTYFPVRTGQFSG